MAKKKDELKKVSKVHTIYKTADGKRVPGVTTILGELNKPALIKWANDLGLDGIDSTKYVDASARVGTLAHYLVQCHLSKVEPDVSEYSQKEYDLAINSLFSFYEWIKGKDITVIETEYKLVSEKYGYGGTCDLYCIIDDEYWLIDFKTGSGVYQEMFFQLAAYWNLLTENNNRVDKAKIIRIGRSEDEGFEERTIVDKTLYWQVFEHTLAIYNLKKEIKGGLKNGNL
jgi:hypothetical protein